MLPVAVSQQVYASNPSLHPSEQRFYHVSVRTEGVKAEADFAKDGTMPDPESTENPEFKIVLRLIRDGLKTDPTKYTR